MIATEVIEKDSKNTESVPSLSIANPFPAREWNGLSSWMNSEALTLESLK